MKPLGKNNVTVEPVIRRLGSLAPLDGPAVTALQEAVDGAASFSARQELVREGAEIRHSLLLVQGWAARTRCLEDGRRQIIHFLLPGDFIAVATADRPIASSAVTALTDGKFCAAPDPSAFPALRAAYAVSHALDEAYLLGQIMRLGRLSAHERIQDLLLELSDRLELAGMAQDGRFSTPLTQEMLADALGLTPVHVNRTLQQARQAGELSWRNGEVALHDPREIRRKVGRLRLRVSQPMV